MILVLSAAATCLMRILCRGKELRRSRCSAIVFPVTTIQHTIRRHIDLTIWRLMKRLVHAVAACIGTMPLSQQYYL